MPEYRYQAVHQDGVPVYGTLESPNIEALKLKLRTMGLQFQHASVLTIDGPLRSPGRKLPRLYQLRVGERIREAFLTGLPTHAAVRAMASEPFEHPALTVMPVVCGVCIAVLLPALLWAAMVPGSVFPAQIMLVTTLVVVPLLWLFLYVGLDVNPRRQLRQLADRLENGEILALEDSTGVPAEIRLILRSELPDERKALAVAELIPSMMGSRFFHHRLLLSMFGSLAAPALLVTGAYLVMWKIVPVFREIFEDFALELPVLTQVVLGVSSMASWLGGGGLSVLVMGLILLAVFSWATVATGWMAEFVSAAPVVGLPFRWLMQARVGRILSAMLQHRCDPVVALRVATAASGFRSVRRDGRYMADSLQRNREGSLADQHTVLRSEHLTSLPMALLLIRINTERDSTESDQLSPSVSFGNIAMMLERASIGQGQFLGMVVQLFMTMLTSLAFGLVLVALFLPLIKLLNDLA